MLRKLFLLAVLTVALLIAGAPASLVDGALARLTDGALRLQQADGSLWHGRGILASRDAGGRSLTPWLPLAWDFDTAALARLAVGWTFRSNGSPLGGIEAGVHGLAVAGLTLHAPADAALASLPHPAARAGWQGDLTLDAPRWQCPPDGRCSGEARLLWRGARSALFPGRPFGDYEIHLTARDGDLRFALHTLAGAIVANGHGEAPFGQPPRFDASLRGDPEFLSRLPAIAGGAARPAGRPGEFEIHWPPR